MKVTICFASGVRHQVQIGTNLPCLKLLQESQDSDTSLEHLFGSDVATEGDCDIDADVLDGTTYFGSPVHTERRTAEVVRNQYTAPHDMPLIAHPWLFDKVIGLHLIDCCRHLADDGWVAFDTSSNGFLSIDAKVCIEEVSLSIQTPVLEISNVFDTDSQRRIIGHLPITIYLGPLRVSHPRFYSHGFHHALRNTGSQ